MGRVKFYGSSDMSIGYHLDRLKEIIEAGENVELDSLWDILEAFNVLKFIQNEIYPDDLLSHQINETRSILSKGINQYFGKASKEDILEYLSYFFCSDDFQLDKGDIKNSEMGSLDSYSSTLFVEDFFECFKEYRLGEKLDENGLREFIEVYPIPIWYFLKTRYFISRYASLMKELFLNKILNFELLLSNYIAGDAQNFIPTDITKDEMYCFCEKYIESEYVNLNYTRLISKGIQGIKELNIDAKLKLKAKKRSEQIEQNIFYDENGNRHGIEKQIAVYTKKEEYDNSSEEFKNLIDIDYVQKENSPENLLEYIMYFDGFFTENWISNLCSFPNFESSTLVRTLSAVYTKKHYETSSYFSCKNSLILLSFKGYQSILKKLFDSRIETLIIYFFETYSKEHFYINWLSLDFTSESEKINIQTKNLFTIEEQIRKQWKLLIEESEIEPELFELESTPSIKSLKSVLDRKYIYANEENNNIQKIVHLLFSDQSHMIYINEELKGENFIQLIVENRIKKSDFLNFQQLDIDFLFNNDIISINNDEIIFITKKQLLRISIMSNIYKYGVIHYYHGNKKITSKKILEAQQQEINEMINEDLLIYKNTLFSRPEVDFLNYVLNNSEFDNALGLRNKYLHGSIVEENYSDYLYALTILVVYIVKINEELCIREDLK